ncbi:MAG: RsmB/NOP family class I SAM-dependent RNA methyltransferase [Pseudomonadota bacterium]
MTPGARVAAAIDCLDEIFAGAPAERVLTRWARANRYAGAKDRAAVRDHVFDALRRRRSLAERMGAGTGRAAMIALIAEDGAEPAALLGADRYAPAPLSAEERARLAESPALPPEVAADVPEAVASALSESLGAGWLEVMQLLRTRATLDLRVNTLRSDMVTALELLQADGVEVTPQSLSPTALRVTAGARRLRAGGAYQSGAVEIMDVASQAVADVALARPGEIVLDFCAGGGGKALALAAAMDGEGRLIAHDADPGRMRDLPARADRAGARIEVMTPDALAAQPVTADLVFIDAPCSGSGAWRRQPDSKWRLTLGDLAQYANQQDQILDAAIGHLAPHGRLIYATCSLFHLENEERAEAFLARQSAFRQTKVRRISPLDGGDGFFVTEFRRVSAT